MFSRIFTKSQASVKTAASIYLKTKPQPSLVQQQASRNYCSNHNHIISKTPESLLSQLSNLSNRTFKTKVSVKKRCADCYFVRRKGILKVYCKKFPRHKQRQG
ncbi:hypothetical protein QEN19_000518 [Hanseniaspora menglaensis]